ncbi:hypothetical protein ACFLV7_02500 [Chloroflexota bacterium]
MNNFPPLDTWFTIRVNVETPYPYTRYDLCLIPEGDLEDFAWHLSLLIARLRLNTNEYVVWEKYWHEGVPIPDEWIPRFQNRFWRGFISNKATEEAGGKITADETALQGHIGELLLYIIQHQLHQQRIDAVPRKPKDYSKDSGIDCLEICGDVDTPTSLHYIVWESKGITGNTIGNYSRKIYNQHQFETPKAFGEAVDQLADLHEDDPVLVVFISDMIDDFYLKPPSNKKCFGGSVSYSSSTFPGPRVFRQFHDEFRDELAEYPQCRQIRLCALGNMKSICDTIWSLIWNKLLP